MENNAKPSYAQLLKNVSEAGFYATDLQLYLDTHPDDPRALELFREACRQYETCREAFESCCYPLRACGAGKNGEWDWLFGVWPGEQMM
ncbi:MAG: spore coat protein CotJB [Bacteroides sp.]|nr:spore coat protein CotJB [Eubacterium sp.]MCM1417729.1 spore coat protein CotJB [Roseburia sp.]MCM1461380.1 spore coat protein CotJB [Bacteroides sp.]